MTVFQQNFDPEFANPAWKFHRFLSQINPKFVSVPLGTFPTVTDILGNSEEVGFTEQEPLAGSGIEGISIISNEDHVVVGRELSQSSSHFSSYA